MAVGFLDKPWLTIGAHPTDPDRDVIYVTYTDFEMFYQIIYTGELPLLLAREMSSTIRLVRSEDGGLQVLHHHHRDPEFVEKRHPSVR